METIDDIVREMRKDITDGSVGTWADFGGEIARAYADRIEKAHKREQEDAIAATVVAAAKSASEVYEPHIQSARVGNAARMREALKEILEIASPISTGDDDDPVERIAQIAEAALAEPVLNCEVGTPEEQMERHDKFCEEAIVKCGNVSTYGCILCFACWAQMPYKKGEEK
jgi:hypothetical protein